MYITDEQNVWNKLRKWRMKDMEVLSVKRKIALMVVILAVALSFMAGKLTAKAADEVVSIQPNQQMTDAISKENDEKWYSFKTQERGYFTVDFSSVQPLSDGDWIVVLYDSNSNEIKSFGVTTGFSSGKFSNHIGDTFYISVLCRYKTANVNYRLLVNYHPDTTWETEYNNTEATATELTMNTDLFGAIESFGDSDIYKITVPQQKGYWDVSLTHNNPTESGEWSVSLYSHDGKTISETPFSKIYNSGSLGFKPGTVLYLKVTSAWNKHEIYRLRANFTPNDFYELEGNDSQTEAMPISLGNEYTGIIDQHRGEEDWYSFSVLGNSSATIEFGPKDVANTGNWLVYLVNATSKTYDLAYTSTRISKSVTIRPGTYYIKVENSSNTSLKCYNLKVTTNSIRNVKTPKIKKVTIKNKGVSGYLKSIKMSAGISGDVDYEVKVAAKKNMKKPLLVTTADAGKSIKSFKNNTIRKKKKTYYVQLRPYVTDCFGNNIYIGSKSNIYKTKGTK